VLVEVMCLLFDDLALVPQTGTHLQRRALQEWIEIPQSKKHLDLIPVSCCATLAFGRPVAWDIRSMPWKPAGPLLLIHFAIRKPVVGDQERAARLEVAMGTTKRLEILITPASDAKRPAHVDRP